MCSVVRAISLLVLVCLVSAAASGGIDAPFAADPHGIACDDECPCEDDCSGGDCETHCVACHAHLRAVPPPALVIEARAIGHLRASHPRPRDHGRAHDAHRSPPFRPPTA